MKRAVKTRPFKVEKDGHSWTDILSWRNDKSKKAFRKLKKKFYKAMKVSERRKSDQKIKSELE